MSWLSGLLGRSSEGTVVLPPDLLEELRRRGDSLQETTELLLRRQLAVDAAPASPPTTAARAAEPFWLAGGVATDAGLEDALRRRVTQRHAAETPH